MPGIQIFRPVIQPEAILAIAERFGITPDVEDLHLTLIWSRSDVDWEDEAFQTREDTLVIAAQQARLELFNNGSLAVLVFECPEASARNSDLAAAGAQREFANYIPHISLGKVTREIRPAHVLLDTALLLGPEVRKGIKIKPEIRLDIEDARPEMT